MSDEEKQPLIKISTSGLSKTAAAFIKKFSPIATHIAKGEVAAMGIKADGMVAISEKLERAGYRVVWKEGNIESIASKAEKYMSPDGREEKPEKINQDWAATFADKCGNTSDEEMQAIWAQILAGEADKPGTSSKRTLSVLSDMDKEDAELFTKFCQFVWLDQNVIPTPLIYDYDNLIYDREGKLFPDLQHLQSIGLILMDIVSVGSFARYYPVSQPICWHYCGTAVTIKPPTRFNNRKQKESHHIHTGRVLLTRSGEELFRICKPQKNDEFFKFVMKKWRKEGLNPNESEEPQHPKDTMEKEKA